MKTETSSIWKQSFSSGLITGALCVLVSLVGMVESFGDTYIVQGLITLGDFILLIPIVLIAYTTLSKVSALPRATMLGISSIIGVVAGSLLTLLILLGQFFENIRVMFINASPALFDQLMRGVPLPLGALVPPIQGLIAALIGLGIISRHAEQCLPIGRIGTSCEAILDVYCLLEHRLPVSALASGLQ